MKTYTNPVYDGSCPDPFVLKHRGEYWAFCTGIWSDGRAFGVLHSPDLLHWTVRAGAMEPLPEAHTCYWAPETVYFDGTFYMYYSVGNEDHMVIRVATSDRPEGPYRDSGRELTTEEFAIDAHVFEDDDGSRWLFYATDFLEHTHVGTGTVCDRLVDPFTLAGEPRPVTRARFDWQVYDPQRKEKGGVRWHTVEGPFVLKRKGRYYEMFSGGNWKNVTYGVSYATSDKLPREGEWDQACDGAQVLPILRTIPDLVIGPGHNSVVRAPDNRQLMCVYHRWAPEPGERVLCVDRLEFVGDRLAVLGPSTTPQVKPATPIGFDMPREPHRGERRLDLEHGAFTCEVTLTTPEGADARCGVKLALGGVTLWKVEIAPDGRPRASRAEPVRASPHDAVLRPGVPHLVRLDVNGAWLSASVDGARWTWSGWMEGTPDGMALFAEGAPARFEAFELTPGFEDGFDVPAGDPARLGWVAAAGEGPPAPASETVRLAPGQLVLDAGGKEIVELEKPFALPGYELVVNARLVQSEGDGWYGVRPARSEHDPGPLLRIARRGARWSLAVSSAGEEHAVALPDDFDAAAWQQFRVRKTPGQEFLRVFLGARRLLEVPVVDRPTWPGLAAGGGVAAFDMVRVTRLEPIDGR